MTVIYIYIYIYFILFTGSDTVVLSLNKSIYQDAFRAYTYWHGAVFFFLINDFETIICVFHSCLQEQLPWKSIRKQWKERLQHALLLL